MLFMFNLSTHIFIFIYWCSPSYQLAESLDGQLKRMGQDLKEIIERLNAQNSQPEDNDPVGFLEIIQTVHLNYFWCLV